MVVFVFRYQSCRIRVRHHQIVFIAKAAFDVAVAADDADQVAAAVVFVADQRTADPDRLAEDGQTLQQRYRQQPHFRRLLVRIFAEPDLFAFEQYRFRIIFIDFRQREQTALIVDIGQSRRIADDALATRYTPALAEPAGTVLVGIIAAAPDQRQDAFKSKVGFTLQKLQPVYRIDRAASGSFAGNTGFGRQFLLELIVHVEHIAGVYDVAFADFNRRRMHHRPG